MTMKKINAFEQGEAILKTLSKGAFLTTAADGKQNTMTIGWGSLGFKWGQPTFTVMVRQSRYTKELIDANPEFTVSFPVKEGFAQALGLCGSKSGRDLDKFAAAGLTTEAGETVSVPVIKGCSLHLECKIVEQTLWRRTSSTRSCAKNGMPTRIGTHAIPVSLLPLT